MNSQVSTALKRLDSILPLVDGLKSLSDEDAGTVLQTAQQLRRAGPCAEP